MNLAEALKALEQAEDPDSENPAMVRLPMAEDVWYTRPDTVSYGIVSLDFEADALNADNAKQSRAFEGSTDLFSLTKNGAGWREMIEATLTEHCGASWHLNSHTYERETGLFHWEWVFQVGE